MVEDKTIYIQIPTKKDEVIVSVAFSYGTVDDGDKEFGIGHLAEHCICAAIQKNLQTKEILGYIDDTSTVIHMKLSRPEYEKLAKKGVINTLRDISLQTGKADVKKEKGLIRTELENQYGSASGLFSEYIKNKLIKQPKRLARRRLGQLDSMNSIDLASTIRTIERMLSSKPLIFVGERHSRSTSTPRHIPTREFEKVRFSAKKNIRIPKTQGGNVFCIAFPVPGIEKGWEAAFSLNFIHGEISRRLSSTFAEKGMHGPYQELRLERRYGFMWFGIHSDKALPKALAETFFSTIRTVIEDRALGNKLKKYKKEKLSEMKSDWAGAMSRQDWVVESYMETGTAGNLYAEMMGLSGVTVAQIKDISQKILNRDKAYIIEN